MRSETCAALVRSLSGYDRLVEVGIGRRPELAAALATAGKRVTATDVYERSVPPDVSFVLDDIVDPTIDLYADADAIYSVNQPPELHRPTWTVARRVGADFRFTTLGNEMPAVPARSERVGRERLYTAIDGPSDGDRIRDTGTTGTSGDPSARVHR